MRLEWSSHRGDPCLRITGPRRDLERLRIYPTDLVDEARTSALPPLAGEYFADREGAVSFVPRLPFVGGMSYTVVGSDFDDVEPLTITWPARDAGERTTRVVEIHPGEGDVVIRPAARHRNGHLVGLRPVEDPVPQRSQALDHVP